MPFINVKASCEITEEQGERIKEGLGRAIARIPGKSEASLMVCLEGSRRMWHAGSSQGPIVMVETAIYGHTTPEAVEDFGGEAVRLIKEELGAKQVYLNLRQGTEWAF